MQIYAYFQENVFRKKEKEMVHIFGYIVRENFYFNEIINFEGIDAANTLYEVPELI